nr:histidine kinase dimerization/phosphoacceptor domain -containing protein [Ramlibacter albus]
MQERGRLEKRFRGLLETAPDAIVIADARGRMVLVNAQAEKMFGHEREALLGESINQLLPQLVAAERGMAGTYPAMGTSLQVQGRRRDGGEFPADVLLSPMEAEEGLLVSAAVRDITRAKEIEQQMRSSLREKEALLQEIHHRVKNNLQIIASMLSLQSGYIRDEVLLEHFQESQGRIRSMALIHEKLYQSETLARIDLTDYIRGLGDILMRTYTGNPHVALELDLEQVSVSIDTAVPVGLQLNELVTNALKYAFPQGRSGTLRVALRCESPGAYLLRVQDDGVGFAPGFDFGTVATLGLRLVRMFARQLRAAVDVQSRPGLTYFEMRFKEE